MKLYIVMISLIALVGCGSDEGGSSSKTDPVETKETSNTSFSVKAKADLPKCDSNKLGGLGYVSGEKKFYSCETAGWTEVSIAGQDGDDGIKMVSVKSCGKMYASNYVGFTLTKYSDGSSMMTCSASNTSGTSTDVYTYKTAQAAYECEVFHDLDTPTNGIMSYVYFSVSDTDSHFNYWDTNSALHGVRQTYVDATECGTE